MSTNIFQFQDMVWIPVHHGRDVTWTWYTTGVLKDMNPHRIWEWSFWDRWFQWTLSHGLGISGKRYTVWINNEWKYVLLCDGSSVKLLRFDGSWGVVSNIWRQVMLRLDGSPYAESVHPVELLGGEHTFMSASQVDYANRFPELIVVKDGRKRVESIMGWKNTLDGTENPTRVILESWRYIQLHDNWLDQLSVLQKAALPPQ